MSNLGIRDRMMLYKIAAIVLTLFLFSPLPALAAQQSGAKAKPLSPLTVTIRPVQQGLLPADIKPGDAVQFEVVALSHVGLTRADLKITFTGGARLAAGDDRWSGPMEKGRETVIMVTVAVPQLGRGKVKATLSAGGFHAGAQFTLGPEPKVKPENGPGKKGVKTKDSKGHDIIEYR
jgi:hypothetical protein